MCGAGDLIEQLQQFVAMVGWTQDMVDLITRREGYFKTVRTNQMNSWSRQKSDRQNPWPLVKLVVLCSGLPQALERFLCISLDSQHELTLNLSMAHCPGNGIQGNFACMMVTCVDMVMTMI